MTVLAVVPLWKAKAVAGTGWLVWLVNNHRLHSILTSATEALER